MTDAPRYRITDDEIHTIAAVEHSHWWYRGMREICFPLLESFLPPRRPLRVLDVGCGTGENLLHLQAYGEAQGIDPNPLCVDYCRRKGLNVTEGSMADLGGLSGPFDLVTMFDVLYQADPVESSEVLSGIHGVLAPGGVLIFREPAMPIAGGPHDRAVGTRQRFVRHGVRDALVRAGFEPLRITYLNMLLFPGVVLRRRLDDLLRGPAHVASDVRPTTGWLNTVLLGVLRVERILVRWADFPFGVSVFAAARKPVR